MKKIHYLFFLFLVSAFFISAYFILAENLSTDTNDWFSASGNCELCHGTSDNALRDSKGNDVSPITHWRSTMLANSSNDPFWRAKVKHEGLVNPNHKEALENVCTRCHAPMGMINALLNNTSAYTLDRLKNDEMGQDGISCTLCHQISGFDQTLFSGNIEINNSKEVYGPYLSPLTQQMFSNTGFTPVQNTVINESRLCGSCHTLITNSVDEHGEFTGNTFVEQALYHEWENSIYEQDEVSCQSCHIPRIDEGIKISNRPGFVASRKPFGVHSLTGGNAFMLKLLQSNHDQLGLSSGELFLDASIKRTRDLLTQSTLDIEIKESRRTADSLFIGVKLENKAGHKFPTGFPSRRAYLEFIVENGSDTIFLSGAKDSDALSHLEANKYEHHHQMITDEKQVQIYEFVMGDDEGEVTTILERAYEPLKDNRIPPKGFSRSHTNYDTVRVVGNAASDEDYFNGMGEERLEYAIPLSILSGTVRFTATVHYETVPESWLDELFSYSEQDVDIGRFKSMYSQMQDKSEVVARDSMQLVFTGIQEKLKNHFKIFPNPSVGRIQIEGFDESFLYFIYSADGTCVQNGKMDVLKKELDLELPSGNYLFVAKTSKKRYAATLIIDTTVK